MLPLVQLPTKSLHQTSRPITRDELTSKKMQKFMSEMVPAMYKYEGVGLAAPQVGENLQICVISIAADKSLKKDLILINPEFEKLSRKTVNDTEGCLSVPGKLCTVTRANEIHVTALDENGKKLSFKAKGFFARVIQHEWDHLHATLIVDKAKETFLVENKK